MCFQTNKTPTFGGCFLNLRFNLLELSISCVVQSWSDQIGRVGHCFNCPLAGFSLERVWCRALINGTRRAPCVAGKTNSGMTVPFAQWADVVSRCGLPGSRLSSFISLSQPVRHVSLQTRKGLAAVPSSKQNVPNPWFPVCWCQCLRPSGPSYRHLYGVIIEAGQWGAFPELILNKRDLSGIRPSPNLAACTRTMLFGTLSCQVMLSMRQRQRTWKVLSFLSCRRKKAKKTLRTFLIWTKLGSEWLNLTDKHYTQTLKVSLPL